MTMIFSLHDSIAPNTVDTLETISARADAGAGGSTQTPGVMGHKISIPDPGELVSRPRIEAILRRSVETYPSTLLCGRAGTGKTSIAASFAASVDNSSWYSIDSTDTDWATFAAGFAAAVAGERSDEMDIHCIQPEQPDIARFLVALFVTKYPGSPDNLSLIVLDDIHHIFDANWFADFFNLLLYSLPSNAHLLLLCRSKPPNPLWRLRSKQMLNVLDEKVIAFDQEETSRLCRKLGMSATSAKDAYRKSYGRISKILESAPRG